MKDLLFELRQEISHLSTKSIGPIGFDYRRRTKLERLLFLISKEYSKNKLNYDIGGLGYRHKKMFLDYTQNNYYPSEYIQAVIEAFKISELICDLSSSDPYAREEALEELGGTVYVMFKNLADKIEAFISTIGSSYNEQ